MNNKNLLFTLADELTKKIYKISLVFPYKFQSSLGDQLRRAILSVILNIVEGGASVSEKERNRFRKIAFSFLKESKYLAYFANDLELIEKNNYRNLMIEINRLAGLLYGLIHRNKS